jgi:hypothetical protein
LYPEVGEGAGDALPGAGVGVGGPPAGEALGGGVEGQLELEQGLACNEASKKRMRKKTRRHCGSKGLQCKSIPSGVSAMVGTEQRRMVASMSMVMAVARRPAMGRVLPLLVLLLLTILSMVVLWWRGGRGSWLFSEGWGGFFGRF